MTRRSSDDDKLGYGKPPKWSQFRKGQSGNPKGRPKKTKNRAADEQSEPIGQSEIDEALRKELSEKITIQTPQGPRSITKLAAAFKAQTTGAIKGNSVAQRELYRQARELEERDRRRAIEARNAEEQRIAEQRENFEKWVKYKALRVEAWTLAEADGREPDEPWPHPDDIILDAAKRTMSIRGPIDAESVAFSEWLRAERDRWFLKSYLMRDRDDEPVSDWDRFWILIWASFDMLLPKRW
jgi:hypothetical protein